MERPAGRARSACRSESPSAWPGGRGRSRRPSGPTAGRSRRRSSSLLNQLPSRPIACATGRPGASASAKNVSGTPSRRQAIQAPTAAAARPRPRCPGRPPRSRRPSIGSPPSPKYVVRRGDHVVDPAADDAERHRPHGDVEHQPLRRAALAQPHLGDRAGGDDAEQDEQGVRPHRDRPEVPDALGRAGDLGEVRRDRSRGMAAVGHGCTGYPVRPGSAAAAAESTSAGSPPWPLGRGGVRF